MILGVCRRFRLRRSTVVLGGIFWNAIIYPDMPLKGTSARCQCSVVGVVQRAKKHSLI